jgi:hypothetical protein
MMEIEFKTSEVQIVRFVISIHTGSIIALGPSLLDWLWPQSACSIASSYLLLPGAAVSRMLGLRMDSPFLYCATIVSAIVYAALIYILLGFRKSGINQS